MNILQLLSRLPSLIAQSLGYKVYQAVLTQSGTSAPVASVLQNTLSDAIAWSRSGVGSYVGLLSGEFLDSDKVTVIIGTLPGGVDISAIRADGDNIQISTQLLTGGALVDTDSLLDHITIEIRVYA